MQDLIIAAYIPPEYLAAITRRCSWQQQQQQQQRWDEDGPEPAGGGARPKANERRPSPPAEEPSWKQAPQEEGASGDVGFSWSIAAVDNAVAQLEAAPAAIRPTALLPAQHRPSLSRPITAYGQAGGLY